MTASKRHKSPLSSRGEVACHGDYGSSSNADHWTLLCAKGAKYWYQGATVYFKHTQTGQYLSTSKRYEFNNRNCRNCPIVNQLEVHATEQKLKSTKWQTGRGVYIEPDLDFEDDSDNNKD